MDRRRFLWRSGCVLLGGAGLGLSGVATGCRSPQAQVLDPSKKDMVGTTAAGEETFKPLVEGCVSKLLARHGPGLVQPAAAPAPCPKRICFVGLENKSCEELGDFKDQIVQTIDNHIVQSKVFQPVSQRFVQAGLRAARLRPDELFLPANQRLFADIMEKQGAPFDYLLYATLTSGTTRANGDYQRDYLLTLELVDIHTGDPDKESEKVRKAYHSSKLGKMLY